MTIQDKINRHMNEKVDKKEVDKIAKVINVLMKRKIDFTNLPKEKLDKLYNQVYKELYKWI